MRVKSLERLVKELSKLPGVGEKSAQRLANHLLRHKDSLIDPLTQSLSEVLETVKECTECYSFTDNASSICEVCENPQRNTRQICVVEEAFDTAKIEAYGKFQGKFHVLGGSLAPLQGVGPDQLKIQALLDRLQRLESAGHKVEEIILILDADLEGDTTALYISTLLSGKNLKISRLAHGIPFGMDIDYIDNRTLGRAFENRVEV